MKNILIFLLLCVSVFGQTPNPLRLKPAASSPAGDDKIYIDGATNGVRALDPTYYQPRSTNLSLYSAITPSANMQSWLAAANYAAMKGQLSLTATDVGLPNVNNTSDSAKPVSTATQTALNGKATALAVGALGSNALSLAAKEWPVKTVTWSSNQVLTYTGGSNVAGDGQVILATITTAMTLTVTPTSSTVYRNGSNSALVSAVSVPIGTHRFVFWTPNTGSTLYLEDTVINASDVPAVASATNYTPTSADVAGNLAGIDTKLGTLGAGGSGSSLSPGTITQASHGFVVGDIVYRGASSWAKARSDVLSTVGIPYYVSAITTNTFVPIASGKVDITGLGYAAGSYRYLSDSSAGISSTTGPTAAGSYTVAVLYCESTTVAFVNPPLPMTNGTGVSVKTTTYTATQADSLIVANSGSPFTITMYNATTAGAQPLTIKNKGAGTLTVDATGLGTIDGSNTITLLQYDAVDLVSDGTVWNVK